jgi:outer membrane protein assembly factor BamB
MNRARQEQLAVTTSISVMLLSASLWTPAAWGQDPSGWTQWRGPLSNGTSPDANPPLRWSETENVRFKVDVEGESLASPVVWEDKIFLLSAVSVEADAYSKNREAAQAVFDSGEWPPSVAPAAQRFQIEARSRHDGKLLWRKVAREAVPHESHYLDSSWACASPIVDGERVYAHFGSNGTYAYDLDGNLLWQIDLGDMTTRRGFGEGSSPALWGDTLVINWDHEGDSFVVALDKKTGKELWRTQRPGEVTSWATPLIVPTAQPAQVVIPATGASRGYDLAIGKELWSLPGMTVNTIPSAVHRDGVVYLASGYRGNMLQAVDLSLAKGELAGSEAVLWTHERDTPYVASVLLYDEQLYFIKHLRNIFTSLDAATGKAHYTVRLPNISNVYASPLGAAGRIYVFDRGGGAVVLRHGKTFEVLAENTLDDGIDATPAMVGSDLYVRGRHHLYRLAEPPSSEP